MKLFPIIVSLLLLSSCGTLRRIGTEVIQKDSIQVVIRERVVHDTATVEITREVERIVTFDTVSVLENTYARSEVEVSGGRLFHSLESKPQQLRIPVTVQASDTTMIGRSEKAETVTVTEYVERQLTRWQIFWMMFGRLAAAGILIGLILYVIRRIY